MRLGDDPLRRYEGNEHEEDEYVRELQHHVRKVMSHLTGDKREERTDRREGRHADGLVLSAHDRMLEALPSARITPVHRGIPKIGYDRHVGVERRAELSEEDATGDRASVRQRRPHERENEEVPGERPAEPPAHRMGKAVHRPMGEQRKGRDVESRHRQGERKALPGERTKRDEDGDLSPEHHRRLAPRELLAGISSVPSRSNASSDDDGDERRAGRDREELHAFALPRTLLVIADKRRSGRRHDRDREERGDPGVGRRFDKRGHGCGDSGPGILRNEDKRRKEHERRAGTAAEEDELLRLFIFLAVLEMDCREDRGDDQHNRDDENGRRRRSERAADDRLVLVDYVGLHHAVGTHELTDLQNLIGHADGHQVDEDIAEKSEILHRDDERERNDRKEQHLVVGKAEAEHERRQPQYLVRRHAHPAIGQEEHPHQEERVERVDLDDRGLGPLHGREREGKRTGNAAAERERVESGR